jgi:hypothetical protein
VQGTMALRGFLDLLKHMRTIILQDACLLLKDPSYSSSAVFVHDVFNSEKFKEFQRYVKMVRLSSFFLDCFSRIPL